MSEDLMIAPSRQTLETALGLAEEILKNIELSEASLSICLLKASRLARLLNDQDHRLAFEYEASGYPSTPGGIPMDVWRIAKLAGRVTQLEKKERDKPTSIEERASTFAVEVLEERIATTKAALGAARDPNVSISSANPHQFVGSPSGNAVERSRLLKSLSDDVALLAGRRGFLHRYVSRKFDELRFSQIPDDIFSRIRSAVDERIGLTVPKAVQKFAAVYENLQSDNPEDWANAVHSCRRILQDLADVLHPPSADRSKIVNGKEQTIKLGPDNYINRLIAFIEENSDSGRYEAVVGSSLHFIGNRLDATFTAAQKGSHAEISSQAEADRYVVYTYMLVADILSLSHSEVSQPISANLGEGQAQVADATAN